MAVSFVCVCVCVCWCVMVAVASHHPRPSPAERTYVPVERVSPVSTTVGWSLVRQSWLSGRGRDLWCKCLDPVEVVVDRRRAGSALPPLYASPDKFAHSSNGNHQHDSRTRTRELHYVDAFVERNRRQLHQVWFALVWLR